jgi:hypothetical protein
MSSNALRRIALAGCLALAPAWLLATAGCSRGGARAIPEPLPHAAAAQSLADWDDVRASVGAALGGSELVLVRLDAPEPDRLVYTLRTSRDEPASLTVQRLDPPGAPDPVRLALTCSVGRFGDAAREREFLLLVAERLEQLKGVEVAPIRR